MAGTIKRSTANFALAIPWFDTPGWGAAFERNMDIIDAVLSTAGVINNIVGQWANNTTYAVDDRVVDPTDDTVWQCAVGHTSAVSGTFAADRVANPTYWDAVSQSVVVRGEFLSGTEYFIGDFVYDPTQKLGGIVIHAFTGGTSLRDNINDIGVIYDLLNEAVWFDIEQSLTAEQQGQARANVDVGILSGFRNKIINGDFDIWQRGTSISGSGYGPDRWRSHTASGISVAVDRVTASVDQPFNYYAQYTFTGTGANGSNVRQRIENVRTLAGKKVTVSARLALATPGTVEMTLVQNFGTGGSPSSPVTVTTNNFEVTSSLAEYRFTLDLASLTGKTFGSNNDHYLELQILVREPNAQTLSVAHVSVVEGDATAEVDPFSPRHIQQEMVMCLRYCEAFDFNTNVMVLNARGALTFSTECQETLLLTPKRALPTISGYTFNNVSPSTVIVHYRKARFSGTATGSNPSVSGTIIADAEL